MRHNIWLYLSVEIYLSRMSRDRVQSVELRGRGTTSSAAAPKVTVRRRPMNSASSTNVLTFVVCRDLSVTRYLMSIYPDVVSSFGMAFITYKSSCSLQSARQWALFSNIDIGTDRYSQVFRMFLSVRFWTPSLAIAKARLTLTPSFLPCCQVRLQTAVHVFFRVLET